MLNTNKIEEIRKTKFRRQDEFCKKIGLSVTNYKKGLDRNDFKASYLSKIAEILEVPVAYFFEESKGDNYNINENAVNITNENKAEYGIKESDLKRENKELKKEIKYLKQIIDLLREKKDS